MRNIIACTVLLCAWAHAQGDAELAAPSTSTAPTSTTAELTTTPTTTVPMSTTAPTTTPTTTARTTTASTTAAPSGVVPPEHLPILYAYKNNRYNTHAYCTTPACVSLVAGRGFTANKTPIGRIIEPTAAALAKAQAACPGVNFHQLGFTKKRQGYMHDLHGYGIPVGYVPLGVECGATLPMKAYSPAAGDDIWYTSGKSKMNVRHKGRVLFYVWNV